MQDIPEDWGPVKKNKTKPLAGSTPTMRLYFGCEKMRPLFKAADSWIGPLTVLMSHEPYITWQLLNRLTHVAILMFRNVISNNENICMFSIFVLPL